MMQENLTVIIDCSQAEAKTTKTSKLPTLCSNLKERYHLSICYLIGSEEAYENYQELSKDLKNWTSNEHIIRAHSNPKLLFLAKRYIDDRNYNDILILSLAVFIPHWKALTSVLLTASAYRIKFESLDAEQIEESDVDMNLVEDDCRRMLMTIDTEEPIKILKSNLIPKDIFYHGFSTRLGGVSSIQTLKSLNLYYTSAKKDPKIVIAENIRRLAEAGGFRPKSLQVVKVEHGNKVWEIGTSQLENYDGLITTESDITIAVPGADCLMLLFADPVQKICAAAHSGCKGTLLKVAEEVVKKMVSRGSNPKDIRVAIGPGVEGRCLQVNLKEGDTFEKSFPNCLVPLKNPEKVGLDLFKINRDILEKNGILPENIDTDSASLCTVCHQQLLYSYERDRRPFGNQMGYIGIRKPEMREKC